MPDVMLQAMPSTPFNFGYRDGALGLTQFPDFEEVVARFAPPAIEALAFDGAVYALPDQMTFDALFYRTVVEPLGTGHVLAIVPVISKHFMGVYFTTMPQTVLGAGSGDNTGIGASTRGLNSVYVSLLYQMDGSLYGGNSAWAEITSGAGVRAFKYWTELYTKHNFIVETVYPRGFGKAVQLRLQRRGRTMRKGAGTQPLFPVCQCRHRQKNTH